MTKKKMCRYYYEDRRCPIDCPCNTNDYCEIIPAKPKWKTIKGWAGKAADGSWTFAEPTYGVLKYPAELRIKTKYLKPAKGKGE